MTVAVLPADAVRPLRQRVLRPYQSIGELVYPGDDHPLALHVGSVLGGTLVGIASIAPAPHPVDARQGDWRLRGMATLPEVRGTGSGAELLLACLEHAGAHGGLRVWCDARSGAVGFYERFGFDREGESFDVPGIGSHVRMTRSL
jgi:predicted GNAT family N-acyltransferase